MQIKGRKIKPRKFYFTFNRIYLLNILKSSPTSICDTKYKEKKECSIIIKTNIFSFLLYPDLIAKIAVKILQHERAASRARARPFRLIHIFIKGNAHRQFILSASIQSGCFTFLSVPSIFPTKMRLRYPQWVFDLFFLWRHSGNWAFYRFQEKRFRAQ